MRFLSAPKESPEPPDAPDVLAEGFFHTSTRLQLTLKTHRSKCEHMQRSGRKLWYCRSPETRPRHRNKSLQAQVGLTWCLGPMLTSAEEWILPTASWGELPSRNVWDPKHYCWQPPAARGAIFCHLRQQVKQCPWFDTAYSPSGKSFSAQASETAKLWEPRHLSFPHPPHTYSTQSNPSAALSAEFRTNGKFLMSNVKSQLAKCSFWQCFKSVYRILLWSAHWLQRKTCVFEPCSQLSAAYFIAEQPEVLLHHWEISAPMHQRCTAVGSKHSAELVLTVPALHTLSKLVRWIPWRRHGDGSMFAAIPWSMGEEHTQPVLPIWDGHTHQVSDLRLSMALPRCAVPWALARSQKWGTEPILIHPLSQKAEIRGMKD